MFLGCLVIPNLKKCGCGCLGMVRSKHAECVGRRPTMFCKFYRVSKRGVGGVPGEDWGNLRED